MHGKTDTVIDRMRAFIRRRGEVSFLWRGFQIARERRRLAPVPPLACDASPLRPLTADDLRQVLESERVDADWATAGVELANACPIADGTTGSANPGDRRAIYYLIRGFAPAKVLEIGTHVGVSTLYIAKALETAGQSPPALTTVDIEAVNDPETGSWKRLGLARAPKGMLALISAADRVRFAQASSFDFMDGCDETFDFIFLDGLHTADTVYQEIPRALRLLAPGGVVLLHDYFPGNRPLWPRSRIEPGPFVATERLCREQPSLAILPLGELPWQTKRNSGLTTLAALTRNR